MKKHFLFLIILMFSIGVSTSEEKEFRVFIPDENFKGRKFTRKKLPGIVEVNSSLINFEPKEVFSWHFSIYIEAKDIDINEMPISKEKKSYMPSKIKLIP